MKIFQDIKKAGKYALVTGMISSALFGGKVANAKELNPNLFSLEKVISEQGFGNKSDDTYSFREKDYFEKYSPKDTSDKGGWSNKDTAWELAYLITHAIDWRQTIYIAKNLDRFHERNPILGKNPSVSEVDRYFAITAIAHLGVSYLLPNKSDIFGEETNLRRFWQMLTIGAQTAVI